MNSIEMEKVALSIEEAARMLSVSRSTIYDLVSSGTLQSAKVGRRRVVLVSALNAYIARIVQAV